MHGERHCPFCQRRDRLTGDQRQRAAAAHNDLVQIDAELAKLRRRAEPIERTRAQVVATLEVALGLRAVLGVPEADLWDR